MTAQEMERQLRSAVSQYQETGTDSDWQKVLDVVYEYAGDEYDQGYSSGARY